ncbi:ABC transporter permease [Halalkalibacter okhensis]|uniref:Multidrug ABC transporter permease n=1 Tax=Halalkalibacter okhensis TaxID=333138 RepID=A0A0B0IPS0_9BACI|nr:ABC transporter permease [Halalkalibacter okhensis]KHF41676.1 multidrug ABC transporter permease [Halalkalibacter okhensis]
MLDFLKKDLLLMFRNRTELFLLLVMPLMLIAILGFALRGLLGGDTSGIEMKVAVASYDDENQGIEHFVGTLNELGLTEETAPELHAAAKETSPHRLLVDLLEDEEFREMIEVVYMEEEKAQEALEAGELTAVLMIPDNFTYQSLNRMFLQQGEGSELDMTVAETGSLAGSIFEELIFGFVNHLNYETAISQALGGVSPVEEMEEVQLGGIETISSREPVSSFQYYTIGMAVMFVLFVGATISSRAFVEKQEHVFNRILLSGTSAFTYLSGKTLSAAVIAFIQLIILFGVSSLIFQAFSGESPSFWLGMLLISLVISICVGGFAALLTTLVIRYNSDAVSNIFSGGIITLFAFAGGSFFPMTEMPDAVRAIGNWTPNGSALVAYLQWIQTLNFDVIMEPLIRILVMTLVLLLVSVLMFPKRRSVSK